MKKVVIDKRIELFKELFPDYTISKNGNYVAEYLPRIQTIRRITYNGFNTTKGILDKIGKTNNIKAKRSNAIFLITPLGKFLYRTENDRYFNNTTMRAVTKLKNMNLINDIYEKFLEIFFLGRKYEYLKYYDNLHPYKIFQNFVSVSEVKKFLGFSFISDKIFINIFKRTDIDYITPMALAKNKVNAFNLLKNMDVRTTDLLSDYIKMCIENEREPEIPAGKGKLKTLHDNLVYTLTKEKAELMSKTKVYDSKPVFENQWKNIGLKYKRLETPYEMFMQGVKQKHCIGTSWYNDLHEYSFYTIFWEGDNYEIQISKNGNVRQFYGYRNYSPLESLKEKVLHNSIDYSHDILKIKGIDLGNYPYKEGVSNNIVIETLVGDLPF